MFVLDFTNDHKSPLFTKKSGKALSEKNYYKLFLLKFVRNMVICDNQQKHLSFDTALSCYTELLAKKWKNMR